MKILDDLEISKAKDTLLIIFLLSIIKNIIFKNLSLLLFKSVIELLNLVYVKKCKGIRLFNWNS